MPDLSTIDTHKASATRQISARASELWRVLSDLESLAAWAPGTDASVITSEKRNGVGAVRQVSNAQFGEIEQTTTEWVEDKRMAYESADTGPFASTLTSFDIASGDDKDTSAVTATIAFQLKPGTMEPEQAKAALAGSLESLLKALEMQARLPARV